MPTKTTNKNVVRISTGIRYNKNSKTYYVDLGKKYLGTTKSLRKAKQLRKGA